MSNNVSQELALTAFGSLRAEPDFAVIQINAQYGILGQVLTLTDTALSGTNTVVNSLFTCQSRTTANGLASITTIRPISVRAGQGLLARIEALFTTGVANSLQSAGLLTAQNSYSFGFVGTAYGITYGHDGISESQELTVTTPAAGAETATVTVDGDPFSVPLTAGTVQHNALEIASSLNTQVVDYDFSSNDDQVVAQSLLSGPQGSFSFTSSTAVAAWVQIVAGVAQIVTFVPQASWNIDTRLTGTAADILDPTKLNPYQIQINSNSGAVNFFVEDNDTGLPIAVHQIKAANLNTLPNVTTSIFRLGWLAKSLGSTTNLTCAGSTASAFIEGRSRRGHTTRSDSNNQLSIGTTLTNIISFRNRIAFNGKSNLIEIFPTLLSVSSQANKSTFFLFLLNPVFGGDLDFSYIDKDTSVMEVAIDSVTVSGGIEVGSLTIAPGGSGALKINQSVNQDILILPNNLITVAAFVTSGAGGDMQAALIWQEDI